MRFYLLKELILWGNTMNIVPIEPRNPSLELRTNSIAGTLDDPLTCLNLCKLFPSPKNTFIQEAYPIPCLVPHKLVTQELHLFYLVP